MPTAQKIIKLTAHCKIIVRGLLDFARQDAPDREAMDLNQFFGEMLSLIEGHVIMRGVEMIKDLEAGVTLILRPAGQAGAGLPQHGGQRR